MGVIQKERTTIMGRTMPTFTRYLEEELSTWKDYRRALCKEDRQVFDRLFRHAKKHIAEASCAARPIPFDALVMSVLLEQQKEIERLKNGDSRICLIPVLTKIPARRLRGIKSNAAAARGIESNVAASRGIESNVAASRGIKSNVAASRGIESNVAASCGIESNVAASRGIKTLTIIHEF